MEFTGGYKISTIFQYFGIIFLETLEKKLFTSFWEYVLCTDVTRHFLIILEPVQLPKTSKKNKSHFRQPFAPVNSQFLFITGLTSFSNLVKKQNTF